MSNNRSDSVKQGSITVFLSLILILILSLLFTIIEGARIHTAKIFAERALTTAMDSILAEYYGPLWEEYHLFGYDVGENSDHYWKQELSFKMQEYMSYTLKPDWDMNQRDNKSLELYGIRVDSLEITDQTMLMDHRGELLLHQAVEYMKYQELGSVLELLLEKMSLLESPKKVSVLYEKKQALEDELVAIDEGTLELMELLDGIKTGKKGLELTKEGKLKTVSNFVKKLCLIEPTQQAVGIHQETIFLSLKNLYTNPAPEFECIESSFESFEEVCREIEIAEAELITVEEEITAYKQALEGLKAIAQKTDSDKQQIEAITSKIRVLKDDKEILQSNIKERKASKQAHIDSIKASDSSITDLIRDIRSCNRDAIEVIQRILDKTSKADPMIKEYKEALYQAREELGDEIFTGMEEDFKELERYTQVNGQGYDFPGMKQTLEQNLLVLSEMEDGMNSAKESLRIDDIQAAKGSYQIAESSLLGYQIGNLVIDYSTIVLEKEENCNPLASAGSFLEKGILSLVVDTQTISKSELEEELLPSVLASMTEEEENILDQLRSFFSSAVVGGKNAGMGGIFGSLGKGVGSVENLGDGLDQLAECFLYQEYLGEHFTMYPKPEENLNARKPSVLTYELEYLLAGKRTDEDNLGSILARILFIRTILNFVSILSDKEKCLEAKLAASALVGFTGLPILVSITKTLILLFWSFAEALVDVSALLMGKELPILKKNVNLSFPEIFIINRSFIMQKASSLKETKEISFSYDDYLRVFLLMKNRRDLIFRSMDLIQENLQIRYEDDFALANCLFGFQVKGKYQMPSRFTAFLFVQEKIKHKPKGYEFEFIASYSY